MRLTQFDCPITFVSPPDMSLTDEFKAELDAYSLDYKEAEHVEQAIADADVILVEPVVQPDYTKSRDEREGDVGMTPANYKITRELLATKAKSDAILLHSLPRMDEIPSRCGYHPLVPLLAGSLQRRGDAHGAPGVGPGQNGVIPTDNFSRCCFPIKYAMSAWQS